MNYGLKLKQIRTEKEFTQQQIAEILNINRSTYKDYELQLKIIPIKYLIKLAIIFEVSIDYLLELTNNKNYQNNKKNLDINLSSKRLKEFRKEHKLTQEKLASILNTTHSMISNYEKAKKEIATPFLYTICKKYNISADYLIGRIDTPKYLK